MNNLLSKLIFLLKKPKVIVVTSKDRQIFERTIFQVLHEKHRNEVLILETGDKETLNLIKKLPAGTYLVLSNDEEPLREIRNQITSQILTFGIAKNADFFATDVKLNGGINFKVNYKGNIVPFWLQNSLKEEEIYVALAAAAVGTIFGLNLVEISQDLKNLAN